MNPIIIPIHWQDYSKKQKQNILQRPAILNTENINKLVSEVLIKVRELGDVALQEFNIRFDRTQVNKLCVTLEESKLAGNYLNKTLKHAIEVAFTNIKTFHYAQKPTTVDIETQPGVRCQQIYRPINSVGIYVPGGTASLFSTVLMLAIPASIAGCKRIVLCSPPPITNEILYVAQLCGIKEIFRVGGAQAIAALAFGTETIPKVDKIFGPGNAYVTEAKRQISQIFNAPATDMPAGPSEVLVIADKYAIPSFIASDLLSQAEHGPDSQVILLTPSLKLANEVAAEIETQLINLPRAITARKALKNSHLIVVRNLEQCVEISNYYGPEHLIIQTRQPRNLVDYITSAGSIFLGDWSPESVGDYASGTNHVLPTYGYAANYSSLGVADFQKRILVQELTPDGLLNIAKVIESLANAEQLEAHKNAVNLRVSALLKEKL